MVPLATNSNYLQGARDKSELTSQLSIGFHLSSFLGHTSRDKVDGEGGRWSPR
jgi:hypothetical protein